jgi:hypothetical protein
VHVYICIILFGSNVWLRAGYLIVLVIHILATERFSVWTVLVTSGYSAGHFYHWKSNLYLLLVILLVL